MSKHNYFIIFLKKINLSINSLLEKYLNKLNSNNLLNLALSNKILLIFVALIISTLSYLSLPHIYDKTEIQNVLKNKLQNKFDLNFYLSKNINYNFFPRPHFIIQGASIIKDQLKITEIKELHIDLSVDSLFSLKNIIIKDVILENSNFNLNKKNSNFFYKILDNKFLENNFIIKNSNIFFQTNEKEVLFINKIINMKYYYDTKLLKNVLTSKNEIFNIPYSFYLFKDEKKKFVFSEIKFKFLNLRIESELDYNNDEKKGILNFLYDKKKSKAEYKLSKNYFNFNFFNKLSDTDFFYKGKINFSPFYVFINGNVEKIDFSNFFNFNSLSMQLLKTEILNNKNLNIDINIDANKFYQYQNFKNILFHLNIREGLIDIDKTKFSWKNSANFEISDSLIYVKDNQLVLNGQLYIDVKNYNEIYKYLQLSKNSRPELKNMQLNFIYNFDQQTLDFTDVKINDEFDAKIKSILKQIIVKKDKLNNKIYFKNMIKDFVIAYAG